MKDIRNVLDVKKNTSNKRIDYYLLFDVFRFLLDLLFDCCSIAYVSAIDRPRDVVFCICSF